MLELDKSQREQTSAMMPLSSRIFGIEWKKHFPLCLPNTDISVDYCQFSDIFSFLKNEHKKINQIDDRWLTLNSESMSLAKMRYYQEIADCFVVKCEQKTIGAFISNPHDWSTYYFRSMNVLPEFQNFGICQQLMNHYIKIFAENNVARLSVDVSPSNLRQLHIFNKLGFNMAGYQCSERWGTLVQLVKYLAPQNLERFQEQFCCGVSTPSRMKPQNFL